MCILTSAALRCRTTGSFQCEFCVLLFPVVHVTTFNHHRGIVFLRQEIVLAVIGRSSAQAVLHRADEKRVSLYTRRTEAAGIDLHALRPEAPAR